MMMIALNLELIRTDVSVFAKIREEVDAYVKEVKFDLLMVSDDPVATRKPDSEKTLSVNSEFMISTVLEDA